MPTCAAQGHLWTPLAPVDTRRRPRGLPPKQEQVPVLAAKTGSYSCLEVDMAAASSWVRTRVRLPTYWPTKPITKAAKIPRLA